MNITRDILETATAEMLGGDVAKFDTERLRHLITLTQYATDIMLNEIERRGELVVSDGVPMVPYFSDHMVETVLTRP